MAKQKTRVKKSSISLPDEKVIASTSRTVATVRKGPNKSNLPSDPAAVDRRKQYSGTDDKKGELK